MSRPQITDSRGAGRPASPPARAQAPRQRKLAEQRLRRQVARSVDAPPALLPWLHVLFTDLRALGCHPRRTVRLMRESGLKRGARVVDLGCGLGAVGLELAASMACRVHGIDGCAAFLDTARHRAARRKLDTLCVFEHADLASAVPPRRGLDAAVLLGVMGVEHGVPLARSWTRRGGMYVIDDAVQRGNRPAGNHWPSLDDLSDLISSTGDTIVRTWLPTPSESRAQNASLYRRLASRADKLGRSQPRLRGMLRDFLSRQREANELLDRELRSAVWIVLKTGR